MRTSNRLKLNIKLYVWHFDLMQDYQSKYYHDMIIRPGKITSSAPSLVSPFFCTMCEQPQFFVLLSILAISVAFIWSG